MKKLNYLFSLLCFMAVSTWAFAQPANNECSGAIDLSSSLGQGVGNMINAGMYNNSTATTEASDPTMGVECFADPGWGADAELQNTLWFKVTGDGNAYNLIASSNTGDCAVSNAITDNDTQIAIFKGECGSFVPVGCNEDSENATISNYFSEIRLGTLAGVDYYIMVDGFDCSGADCGGGLSAGEFCVLFTQIETITCNNPDVVVGTAASDPIVLCKPDSVAVFSATGSLAPNEGEISGAYWVISSSDLMGTLDPLSDPSILNAFYVPDGETSETLNFGSDFGIYYMTQYIFGNATWTDVGNIVETTFDDTCIYVSNSIKLEYYPEDACPTISVLDVDKAVLGMTVFPNPVKDVINLNINAEEQHSNATLMITNVTGQVVDQQRVNLLSGANTFDINVSDMPSGVYMVSIESETHQSVTKFVKQ